MGQDRNPVRGDFLGLTESLGPGVSPTPGAITEPLSEVPWPHATDPEGGRGQGSGPMDAAGLLPQLQVRTAGPVSTIGERPEVASAKLSKGALLSSLDMNAGSRSVAWPRTPISTLAAAGGE